MPAQHPRGRMAALTSSTMQQKPSSANDGRHNSRDRRATLSASDDCGPPRPGDFESGDDGQLTKNDSESSVFTNTDKTSGAGSPQHIPLPLTCTEESDVTSSSGI